MVFWVITKVFWVITQDLFFGLLENIKQVTLVKSPQNIISISFGPYKRTINANITFTHEQLFALNV